MTSGDFDVLVLFMQDESATVESEPEDAEARAEARTARQLAMLQELAEIGLQIARAVRDEALARAEPVDEEAPARVSPFGAGDLGLIYSRISRAVRQTLALESRIAEGLETARFERRRSHVAKVRSAFEDREREVRDYVAEAIENEGAERRIPDNEVERLLDDLDERLEDGQYDDALADGPIAELVARICEDLGVSPDWRIWDDQDWAIDYIKERMPDDIGADRWAHLDAPIAAARPPNAHGPPPDPG